jgi:hypothetical protein
MLIALTLFAIGVCLAWASYEVSGCPGFLTTGGCKTGWESNASDVLAALAWVAMIGGPIVALVGVPVLAHRRRSRSVD